MQYHNQLLVQQAISAYTLWLKNSWSEYRNLDDADSDASPRDLTVQLLRTPSSLRELNKLKGKIEIPFNILALGTIEVDTERGGHASRYRSRQLGRLNQDASTSIRNLTPVSVGLASVFYSDTIDDVLLYTQMLMDNSPKLNMILSSEIEDVRFEVGVVFSPQFDIPTESDKELPYGVQTTFILKAWMGRWVKQGLIRDLQVNFKEATGGHRASVSSDALVGKTLYLYDQDLSYDGIFDENDPSFRAHKLSEDS